MTDHSDELLAMIKDVKVVQFGNDVYIGATLHDLGFFTGRVSRDFRQLALEWEARRLALVAKAEGK